MGPLIYLDNNATTPCDPGVLDSMLPYFSQHFGNAASQSHAYGWSAEEAVDLGREQTAALIGAGTKEIIFTSGATEAVNLAIKGAREAYSRKGNHIITCVTEHKAVLDTCVHLERSGALVTYLPVDANGHLDLDRLSSSVRPETILIALMYANNETGLLHPIREISTITRRYGVPFFTDATQAVGKVPVDVEADGIDLLALSAHKIYGPKGAGALYVRRRNPRVSLIAQMDGGGHERGLRSGTLNVPGIVGLGKAAALCMNLMGDEAGRLSGLRDQLESSLAALGSVFVNGDPSCRLPGVSSLSFGGVDGEALLIGVNKFLAVSSGSACTSASMEPSHVLKAMGRNDGLARATLRFGIGRFTTTEQVTEAARLVAETVRQLRESEPA